MAVDARRDSIERTLSDGDGILRLEPAWVGRDFLPAGRRLGLRENAYELGERGEMCERWLASTTKADNRVGPPDEGLSYIAGDGTDRITLKQAVESAPEDIMGAEYAATHDTLGRLAKIFDYSTRLPLHLHQRQQHDALVADHGFHIPSGVLHAPGSSLTIELQEDSDVFAMLQALNAGKIISKELLWKDVRAEDRETKGERFVLELIDWEQNGDPYFYNNHHLRPQPIEGSGHDGGEEFWIYYGTTKFSGKKLVVDPGCTYLTRDAG